MPADPRFASPPRWINPIVNQLVNLGGRGLYLDRPCRGALFGFLLSLEFEEYPEPRVEILGPAPVRLSWSYRDRSMRLDVTDRRIGLTTSRPQARGHVGKGQLVNG